MVGEFQDIRGPEYPRAKEKPEQSIFKVVSPRQPVAVSIVPEEIMLGWEEVPFAFFRTVVEDLQPRVSIRVGRLIYDRTDA